jgi:hypothetical protein
MFKNKTYNVRNSTTKMIETSYCPPTVHTEKTHKAYLMIVRAAQQAQQALDSKAVCRIEPGVTTIRLSKIFCSKKISPTRAESLLGTPRSHADSKIKLDR